MSTTTKTAMKRRRPVEITLTRRATAHEPVSFTPAISLDRAIQQKKLCNTFAEVLANKDEQRFVHELLERLIPRQAQDVIVQAYNAHVRRFNARNAG